MKHNKEYSIPLNVILFHSWYFYPPSLIKLTSQFHSSHLNSLVRRGILRVAHRSIQHNDLGRSLTQISFPKSTAVIPLCLSAFQSTEMLLVQDGSSNQCMHFICFPIDQARINIKDGKFKICWPQGKNFTPVWKTEINDTKIRFIYFEHFLKKF